MISAHRCGAGDDVELENTQVALDRALVADVDFVEFDVQRLGDGHFVLFHDDHMNFEGVETNLAELTFTEFASHADHFLDYETVLKALAGKKKAHIDFKFTSAEASYATPESTDEVRATKLAIDILGVDNIIVTTLEDQSVKAVRAWSKTRYPSLLVGLSLGRDLDDAGLWAKLSTRLSELFPGRRYSNCDANLVVVNKQLARATVSRWARRKNLPVLVWTVDSAEELSYWLAGRAWLVTTNFPDRAIQIRGSVGGMSSTS